MFCSKCGYKLESDWVVCPCCSTPVIAPSSESTVGQTRQTAPDRAVEAKRAEVHGILRGLKWGCLVIVVILALLGGYLGWTEQRNQDERHRLEAERMKDPAYAAAKRKEAAEWENLRRAMYRQAYERGDTLTAEQEALAKDSLRHEVDELIARDRARLDKEPAERAGKAVPQVPPSKQITTHSDFDHSEFCRQFHCEEKDSWPLQNGDTNHTYNTNVDSLSVEVNTKGELVTGLGLMFLERSELSGPEFAVVESLLRSIDQTQQHGAALSFIKQNVEKPVPQIRKAQFTTDGDFRIWAGRVGPEQGVAFERVRP